MRRKQVTQKPLLYIHQPTEEPPKAAMQQNYMSPREEQQHPSKDRNLRRTRPIRNYFVEDPFERHETYDEPMNDFEETTESTDKKFGELSLRGKIQYFVDIPEYAPKIKCELITSDRSYRGIITGFKDDEVYIRHGRRTTSEKVPFSEVKDVQILGF